MQEFFVDPITPEYDNQRLIDPLVRNAQVDPGHAAVSVKVNGAWQDVSAAALHDEVRAIAKGIAASGVQPGDRVGIMSRTRYEWTLVDYALWYAGAVPVPIYETSSAEQVEWILSDSGAVGVFLETTKHIEVFDSVPGSLPGVTRDLGLRRRRPRHTQGQRGQVGDDDLEQRLSTVTPETVATIIYTSGTTGRPKGCTLTHGNFMSEIDGVVGSMPEIFTPDSSTLLFLPMAHVFGRAIQLGCIQARVRLAHSPDINNLLTDLGEFQPHFLLAVPRVFEKVFNSAQQKADGEGKGTIFNRAASIAIQYSRDQDTGGSALLSAPALHLRQTRLQQVARGHGRQRRHAISGGAALGERLGHFFRGIGIRSTRAMG